MAPIPRVGLALRANDQGIHDIYLAPDGNLAMVRDAEAVGQHARQRLKSFQGEWYLNKDSGIPWFRDILGHGYDPALAEAVIKAHILGTDGVTKITSFSTRFDLVRRELKAYDIHVRTEYDEEIQL